MYDALKALGVQDFGSKENPLGLIPDDKKTPAYDSPIVLVDENCYSMSYALLRNAIPAGIALFLKPSLESKVESDALHVIRQTIKTAITTAAAVGMTMYASLFPPLSPPKLPIQAPAQYWKDEIVNTVKDSELKQLLKYSENNKDSDSHQ